MITGIFGAIAGAIGLANSDKTGLVKKAVEGVDNINLSEEERAQYILEYIKSQDDQNSIRSVMRRIFATIVVSSWAILTLGSAILIPINKEWSDAWKELATSNTMMVAMGSIIAFYFYIQAVRAKK
ncbi:MAG: hypothetical protein V3R78_10225 [Thermodesulfobacteriota bacterium]